MSTIIIIAKEPVPGSVKTRLVPPLSYEQAAAVALAALEDTLDIADAYPCDERLLALQGKAGAWLPSGWSVTPQPAGGLDLRLVAAFEAAGPGPALLVGMDTPQVGLAQLTAFDPASFDACLGLAEDGGFWAIGFADPSLARPAIAGVLMSTVHTGAQQLSRLRAAGLRVQLLDPLADVDTIDVAHQVASLAPHTRFAAVLAQSYEQVG